MTSRYGIGPNVGRGPMFGAEPSQPQNREFEDEALRRIREEALYRRWQDATNQGRINTPWEGWDRGIPTSGGMPGPTSGRYGIGPQVGNQLIGGGAGGIPAPGAGTEPYGGGQWRIPGMPREPSPIGAGPPTMGRFNPSNYSNEVLQEMVKQNPAMAQFLPKEVWAGFGNEFFLQNPQFMNQLSRERIRGEGQYAPTGFASDVAERYAPGRAGIGTPQPTQIIGGTTQAPYIGPDKSPTTGTPISYEDFMGNPRTSPRLRETFGGGNLRSPRSPFPRISPQDYANLMPIERAQLGAGLKGAGINPEDYYAQTRRLTQAPNLEGSSRAPAVGRYGRYGGY